MATTIEPRGQDTKVTLVAHQENATVHHGNAMEMRVIVWRYGKVLFVTLMNGVDARQFEVTEAGIKEKRS